MSTNSDDPFTNPNAAPRSNQGQVSHNDGDLAQTPPRNSRRGLWIGCGAFLLIGLLVCCGGPLLMIPRATSELARVVQAEIEGNPTVEENLGEIESISLSLTETMDAWTNLEPGQEPAFTFEAQGTEGNGNVVAIFSADGRGIDSAILVMPDGTQHQVELVGNDDEFEELNMDELEIESGDLLEVESGDLIDSGSAEASE